MQISWSPVIEIFLSLNVLYTNEHEGCNGYALVTKYIHAHDSYAWNLVSTQKTLQLKLLQSHKTKVRRNYMLIFLLYHSKEQSHSSLSIAIIMCFHLLGKMAGRKIEGERKRNVLLYFIFVTVRTWSDLVRRVVQHNLHHKACSYCYILQTFTTVKCHGAM